MAEIKEEVGREALGDLTRRFTEQQRELGVLPSTTKAQEFVKPIVDQVLRKNEVDGPAAAPTAPQSDVPKSRLERGEIPDDATLVVNKPIVSKEIRDGQFLPKEYRNQLLRQRLLLLHSLPEWRAKLKKAGENAEALVRHSGVEAERTIFNRRWDVITNALMKVIEDSNRVFGDYLAPRFVAPKIYSKG